MNRRHFLQSLAAIGLSVALPEGVLGSASEAAVEQAWQTATRTPLTFYVSSWGSISFGNDENWPKSRMDLLGLFPVRNRADLVDLADDLWTFESFLYDEYVTCCESDGLTAPDWQSWIAKADDETLADLIDRANAWMDKAADSDEWEIADLKGYSDRGAALAFFRDECEFTEMFDIAIVEGDHPGSTYYAAELGMDIDEANALAVAENLPIRFEAGRD